MQWQFVIAAYAVAILATAALLLTSARSMSRAEARLGEIDAE